jgi:hypothetical protein
MAVGKMDVIPGTRYLAYTSGLIGKRFIDPHRATREWTVIDELCPLREPLVTRLRVRDQCGVVSFINELDFDVLRHAVRPGSTDHRTMQSYPDIGDYRHGWEGLHVEYEDLDDDLLAREVALRNEYNGWYLPLSNTINDLARFIHTDGKDYMFIEKLIQDVAPETGVGPDWRFETISKRWSQYHKENIDWECLTPLV